MGQSAIGTWQQPWGGPQGYIADLKRGRQSFRHYVEQEWLPNHVLALITRQTYTLMLRKRIMPFFGNMRLCDIFPLHVRQFVAHLQETGVKGKTVRHYKTIIDAVFTTACHDGLIGGHPSRGIKVPKTVKKPKRIISVAEYEAIYEALDDDFWRLLVETDIETGARWGELTELRPKDFDFHSHMLTISRAVVQLEPEFHPTGERFYVKDYPKDGETRELKISAALAQKLKQFVTDKAIGPDDLLFEMPPQITALRRFPDQLPDPTTLGRTSPTPEGRSYWHGTATGYGPGGCRCRHCKNAVAAYRARRRASGKDHPRTPRAIDTNGHISGDHFRRHIFYPAVQRANIGRHITPRNLRDAHASWLLAGGADIYIVRDRLGHSSITTTEIYLGRLTGRDDIAVKALAAFRQQGSTKPPTTAPSEADIDLEEIRRLATRLNQMLTLNC